METGKRPQKKIASSPRILELKKRKRKALKIKIGIFCFLFLSLLTGLVFLSRWDRLNINEVRVSGNKIIDAEEIENLVNNEINGYYLWVIPKSNFLILPKKYIKHKLLSDFKRIEHLEVELKDIKTLEIFITERKALYTWCGPDLGFYQEISSLSDEEDKKCYFLNDLGYVFDKAPYFSGNVYFKFFGSLADPSLPALGQSYFPDDFNNLVIFMEGVKSMELKPSSMLVKEDGDVELYLKASSFKEDSNKIIFNINGDIPKLLENLKASLATEPLKSEIKNKYEDLLYIDLRFGNKVYYKFR